MYDVIVVGARCAGSPTAMLLARQGHRVLLVDKATFPSDTISTHGILARGLAKLLKWGIYQRLQATDCPEISKVTLHRAGITLTGYAPKSEDGLPFVLCPRRTVLDTLLVTAAIEAGVELREGFAVREILTEGDRIAGIKGMTRGGHAQIDKATIVIGADGRNSLVARVAQADRYNEVPPLMCWYYTYWSNIQDHGFADYVHDHRKMIVIPTNGGLTCVLVGWPHADFPRIRANIATEYMAAIQMLSPQVAERLLGSIQAERFYGMADLPNFFRKPYGPGWALVGDAGYHKDPVNAHGIADAFRDADLLAEAVHLGLSGELPMKPALADYERRRNEDASPRYEENCKSASFQPWPEDKLRLLAAVRAASQEDINTFMGAMVGTLPHEAFFNPKTLARILAHDDG